MENIIGGDYVLLASIILSLVVAVVVMCILMYMYHKVYLKSELEENLNKTNPSRKHYLVTRTEQKKRLGFIPGGTLSSIPVYEGPSRETVKKSEIEPNKMVTSRKYEVGYYYLGQFDGWVSCDDVKQIGEKDKSKYESVISINHKKHKFSIVIVDENAQIHVSPDFISRIKFTSEDSLIELNREYHSDVYDNNWYYLTEFGGWIHEGSVKSRCLY